MCPGELEARRRVVERGGLPCRGAMAALAGLRKSVLHVIRIRGALEILEVARDAGGAGQVVVPVDMTLRARGAGVRSGQREANQIVVKRRRRPGGGGVTGLAGLRETELHVVRVLRLLEIRQVATDAGGRRALIFSAQVAGGTVEGGVRPGKRKSGEFQVIELRA